MGQRVPLSLNRNIQRKARLQAGALAVSSPQSRQGESAPGKETFQASSAG